MKMRGRIPAAVLTIARLDDEWLSSTGAIDVEQLKCRLLFEFVVRSDTHKRPQYSDGWNAIGRERLDKLRRIWWDVGCTAFAALRVGALVAEVFALGSRDVTAAHILPTLASLGITLREIKSMDWKAVFWAERASRGADPRSSNMDPLQRALYTQELRERRRVISRAYMRQWYRDNPEKRARYQKTWREKKRRLEASLASNQGTQGCI